MTAVVEGCEGERGCTLAAQACIYLDVCILEPAGSKGSLFEWKISLSPIFPHASPPNHASVTKQISPTLSTCTSSYHRNLNFDWNLGSMSSCFGNTRWQTIFLRIFLILTVHCVQCFLWNITVIRYKNLIPPIPFGHINAFLVLDFKQFGIK